MDRFYGVTGGALMIALAVAPVTHATEVLHAPDAVRACLCRNQSVTELKAALDSEQQQYSEQKQALDKLEQQASAAKQNLNDESYTSRQALAQLLNERDAARDRFAQSVTPRYNQAVTRYNAAVQSFNDDCAGKAYDPATVAKVRPSLACPPTAAIIDPKMNRA